MALLGLLTTAISSVLACIPPADEPNKAFAVAKLLLSSFCLVGLGAVIYWAGRKKSRSDR